MKVTLIQTGRTKESYLKEGEKEYHRRIVRYIPFNVITIPDLKSTKKSTEEYVKQQEGVQQIQRIKPGDFVILLDERGKAFSSQGLADYLAALEGRTGHTVFIIGGAYGFSKEVYERADASLSLSNMTFSHQMVRLIFSEQLYRALTIQRGEPYHHN